MTYRDRSQGFGFVYFDIASLLRQAQKGRDEVAEGQFSVASVNLRASEASPAKPDIHHQNTDANLKAKEVQQNLDRLQSLHQKLHVMLQEVDSLTQKKKK